MKDDLVEGREVLRLDDLGRQEMMAVQLDEAKGFLARGTVAHARLAFIWRRATERNVAGRCRFGG